MNETLANVLTILLGGVLGFGLKWLLAERQEQHELRRSIAPNRVEAYRSLWVLCEKDLKASEAAARREALLDWYNKGGGLFLSLAASQRFFSALKLLTEKISEGDLQEIREHLTWLRTEMKHHVGSYTRRDKKTQIRASI